MERYFGKAVFRVTLQSGSWPGCDLVGDGSLDDLRRSLGEALLRDGLEFSFTDLGRDIGQAVVEQVYAPVPCGDMDPVADLPGGVVWRADRAPKPGTVWTFGQKLSEWLNAVPWVTDDFSAVVGLVSLEVQETDRNEPGQLWPQ